jgi:hypothetical protein
LNRGYDDRGFLMEDFEADYADSQAPMLNVSPLM